MAIVEVDHPSVRTQVDLQSPEVGDTIIDVMVGEAGHRHVDFAVGKLRVLKLTAYNHHVLECVTRHSLGKLRHQSIVHLHGVNPTVGPNRLREPWQPIAASRSDLGHSISRFQVEGGDHLLRVLPAIATGRDYPNQIHPAQGGTSAGERQQ